jgi:hypothetical protein
MITCNREVKRGFIPSHPKLDVALKQYDDRERGALVHRDNY